MSKEIDDALRVVLASKEGRKYIYELIDFCGLHRGGFVSNGSQTFFNEGQRNVALKIFGDVGRVDPNAYLKMIEETKNKKEMEK